MPFTGVHITYGLVNEVGRSADLFGPIDWSQTFSTGDAIKTTALSAIRNPGRGYASHFMVQPSVDVFVAIGPNPDASASPRSLVLAGERVLIPCTYGDKLAWVAA